MFGLWGGYNGLNMRGLHVICFNCGQYGHRHGNCSKLSSAVEAGLVSDPAIAIALATVVSKDHQPLG